MKTDAARFGAVTRWAMAALATLVLSGQAAADTRTIRGDRLVLTDTLDQRTVIDTDPSLSGSLRVSADGSLGCLTVVPGQTVVVGTSRCGDDLEAFRITVSPDMPVVVSGSGDGGIRIGDLNSALTVTLNGGYDLTAGHANGLVLVARGGGDAVLGQIDGTVSIESFGGGDVKLKGVNGPVSIRHQGSGDLTIGPIQSSGVTIDSSGSGDMAFGSGSIASLTARMSGSGDLAVAATITAGTVAASGGGDVKLASVTGALRRAASGGSDITVSGPGVVTDVTSREAGVRDESGTPGRKVVIRSSHVVGHLIALILVGVMLFFVWRMVRRGRSPALQTGPLHPGVTAVCETMTRLEQRLGRMESYVTTREFDLNRKFRDLR